MGKAILLYWHKAKLKNRYVLEMKIHRIEETPQYKDGLKYRLILVDLKTNHRVLMDNHHPKGDHIHLDDTEFQYDFINEERLIQDFKQFCLNHMGVTL